MIQKTAISELIEYFTQQLSLQRTSNIKYTTEEALLDVIDVCKNAARTKEKEQLAKAYNTGKMHEACGTIIEIHLTGEQYYNETYKQ
jgi:hypothetical protein